MTAPAQEISWKKAAMDASRTGVLSSTATDVDQTMGTIDGTVYNAPNGRKFRRGRGVTFNVAELMITVQPSMADVKTTIGHAPKAMRRHSPECELSDWFIDALMKACEEKTGLHVDMGIANFGGIRVDMPKGDILVDDIMSMFPFRNNLCYLELEGRDIRTILERMAARSFQVLGGVKVVAKNRKLVSATIGGKPIEDDKLYGIATISFLLNGGDSLSLARNSKKTIILDEYIIDVMLPYVKKLTAEGKPIEYQMDGRVTILK